jgi:hypothetical protein
MLEVRFIPLIHKIINPAIQQIIVTWCLIMDRSFIISGVAREGESVRPIAGVLFSNSPPDMQALCRAGFADIQSVDEVKPLSNQPTEPTLYLYARSPAAASVEVVRLDWGNNEVSRARANGEPSFLVPPVSGPAADRHLYAPRAYVISANVKESGRSKPVVAVLFIKPAPGEKPLAPDKKTLNRLGLVDLQFVERVETAALISHSQLYLFERSPSAKCVSMAKIGQDGTAGPAEEKQGEPHSLIPAITGSAADRFVNPRNAPSATDFTKSGIGRQSDMPPSSKQRFRRT